MRTIFVHLEADDVVLVDTYTAISEDVHNQNAARAARLATWKAAK